MSDPITPKQAAFLQQRGVNPAGYDKQTASRAIDQLLGKTPQGQNNGQASHDVGGAATYKQRKVLEKYGYNSQVSFQEASSIIQSLRDNDWQPLGQPQQAAPQPYPPAPQYVQQPVTRPTAPVQPPQPPAFVPPAPQYAQPVAMPSLPSFGG